MAKLYTIRFLKNTELCKVGDIREATKKNAESYIKNRFAEYVEEENQQVIQKEADDNPKRVSQAKYLMDKATLETSKNLQLTKSEATGIGVHKDNYYKIHLEKGGLNYFRELAGKYDTFAEVKSNLDLELTKDILKLKEVDLKEVWKKDFKEGEKQQKEIDRDHKKEKSKNQNPFFIFEKEAQAIDFIKHQPLFYDRKDIWWLWNFKEKKWEITDKTDILNGIKKLGVNTINSKDKVEILNALQQSGRENLPTELSNCQIQFKDKIINIKTGQETEASSEYFSTNPIPWKIGESEETPNIDKYFKEWVGEEYVKTLYEVIAYCSCSEQFLQRMIALVGGGSNGKGTFIKLLKKFVGKENVAASELSLLSSNQFETSMIYKKLLCEMGEVSYDDLKNTNQIKKLSGEDDIRYCFKGKTPFSNCSPTTCIINTNSLPNTPDKTIGFYRRWLIVDFPNQFKIKEGLIETIPEEEFNNLAKKVISILKQLYENHAFTNEGDFEERAKRYENRSNPVMQFVKDYCNEEAESYTSLKLFHKELVKFLVDNHLRMLSVKDVKKILTDEGFDVRRTTKFGATDTYIFNLNINSIPLIP
mgnify:CR=1 FL=1|jgi:P4 family phage/plasmid primase-like protien|tara:strand:- start:4072 stop:5841 length:1770 start_codon:yes stop_codon:yes gene_type:complete